MDKEEMYKSMKKIENEFVPAVNGWESVDRYLQVWGELHPTTQDKLIELSRKDLVDICLSAMSAMADEDVVAKAVKRIKKII